MSLWDKGNEVCTERDCSLASRLGEGNKHYRWQRGSDHVEGYGNTNEEEADTEPKEKKHGRLRGIMEPW